MTKVRTNWMNKKNGVVKKLRKRLLLWKKFPSDDEPENESRDVPGDVKEGHFAVIATDDDDHKRFVVPLDCLTHPSFLRLLEQAAEVYGFDHEGALTLPCRPSEMERILALIYMEFARDCLAS
ncbi:unnamed protein product [Withania somnifera]